MSIMTLPEDILVRILWPKDVNDLVNPIKWLPTCKTFYRLKHKFFQPHNAFYYAGDIAANRIATIISIMRSGTREYFFSDSLCGYYMYSLLFDAFKLEDKLYGRFAFTIGLPCGDQLIDFIGAFSRKLLKISKEEVNAVNVHTMNTVILFVIAYKEMMDIIKIEWSEQGRPVYKIRFIQDHMKETITRARSLLNPNRYYFDVKEDYPRGREGSLYGCCISNGKFCLSVTNMFCSIVGLNTRRRITDLKMRETCCVCNTASDSDDYDDHFCVPMVCFTIAKHEKRNYKKINHFYNRV